MQLVIQGKNMEVSDWLRQYVEKKAGKLDRLLPNADEVRVELSVEHTKSAQDRQVVQMTVRSNGRILRAEEKSADMFASVDAVMDKIHRQISRFKERRHDRRTQGGDTATAELPTPVETEEETPRIVRVKRFVLTPMDEEEAAEQMELLGHDFFVFYNSRTAEVNVVYRRHDGNYGLLQPQLP
ncbi:MAG: ribosome-associated translation inhibitor RaiA [Anaerolineae bacterium]|nr:ribosome-associated translation inhibitor RaiA [Anaerolineae bacterium]